MRVKPLFALFFLFTFLINCSKTVNQSEFNGVIPQPDELIVNKAFFKLGHELGIDFGEEFDVSGKFISSFLESAGLSISKGDDLIFIKDEALEREAYELHISTDQIQIRAATDQGAFYAVQSLRQVLPVSFETGEEPSRSFELPCLKIRDVPRFQYRGMHLDVGRHMFPVDFIKKYIDALAMLKMNTFHWHLTEDQGWRIEIKQYPKLQEVAAYRKETLVGHYSDQPHQFDGMRYGGYYTQEEIKEIVAYAQARFVTIIPEIEMPGHSQAAIAAYPELGCKGNSVEVATKWGVFETIYCPKEETFRFLENVLDEVMALFPSTYIHIGGDEAPKTHWKDCEECQELMKKQGLSDENELQNYFITRMERYLNSKGRQIIGWDEILEGGLAPNATVMSWRGTSGAIAAARQQHQVVMTPTSYCYFDYYQAENDEEPLAIGGFLPLEKVYSFDPIPEELTAEEAQYVWGAQGNIWTEYMPIAEQVEYMAFPRMLAMSEVVWTDLERKDYKDFVDRVEQFHNRLEVLDINYANHLYEIKGQMKVEQGKAFYEMETLSNGKTIHYTLDGTVPDFMASKYESAIPITKSVHLKAQVFDGDQKLGDVFEQDINFHKGVGAKIHINNEPHKAYSGSGSLGLINGISGSDQRYGDKEWLGFWGEDIEIEIEFDKAIEINSIKTRFHNGTGQWIYAPREFVIEWTLDNDQVVSETIKIPEQRDKVVDVSYFLQDDNISRVTDIMLKVPNYGTIPEGKQGAGHKAWTFIDELIIN